MDLAILTMQVSWTIFASQKEDIVRTSLEKITRDEFTFGQNRPHVNSDYSRVVHGRGAWLWVRLGLSSHAVSSDPMRTHKGLLSMLLLCPGDKVEMILEKDYAN